MQTEQNLTDFNKRVQRLRAITGKSQTAIAAELEVSRTTLHYYCTGQSMPKAAALFRLEQAERRVAAVPGTGAGAGGGAWKAPSWPGNGDESESSGAKGKKLGRHLRWLRGAQARQEVIVRTAQEHLWEIEGWVREAEEEVERREAAGSGQKAEGRRQKGEGKRMPAEEGGEQAELRDIATVSLPIFGALPAGWPQTREGVAAGRPVRSVAVRSGLFPEGAFGLEVRGDSMNAARPVPIFDREIVVLVSPEQRSPQHDDIVAALIDGETCLKRLKLRKKRGAFLQSESTNPAHGTLHPTHDLVIQGVLVGKL